MVGRRRIKPLRGDKILIGGYEVDFSTLEMMFNPEARMLWAFIRNAEGEVQPVSYAEDRVIWLQDEDLVRSKTDV